MTQPPDPRLPPVIRSVPPDVGGAPAGYARVDGYGGPASMPGGLSPAAQFFAALCAGFSLSLVVWAVLYWLTPRRSLGTDALVAAVALLVVKVIASIVLMATPRWRMLGGGLLTSIAAAFLTCGFGGLAYVCGGTGLSK
ncbi:MAG TPA: hypothetical protein VF796_15465 [Humisphaera sp.]